MNRRSRVAGPGPGDAGSVTPLVIGMMLCLLVLGAGVIAAGSAVLARRDLQSACDGATTAVAGSVTPGQLAGAAAGTWDTRFAEYLARRMPGAVATSGSSATALIARCEADGEIAFGVLFGSPTVRLSVESVSQVYRG